jgi:hypothetical protein
VDVRRTVPLGFYFIFNFCEEWKSGDPYHSDLIFFLFLFCDHYTFDKVTINKFDDPLERSVLGDATVSEPLPFVG